MASLRFAAFLLAGVALSACSGSNDPQSMATRMRSAENELSGDLDVQIRRAQMLRLQGNYTEATRAISQMMLAVPDDPRVVGEYGKLLAQKGQPQDAIAFLRRATELNPTDWTLYSAMGVCYDQSNDPNAARVAYDRALSLKPNDPTVLNNYAMSRVLAGDLPEAARLIQQARASGSSDPKIQRNAEMIASLVPADTVRPMAAMNAPTDDTPQRAPIVPVTRAEAPKPVGAPFVALPQQQPSREAPIADGTRQPTGSPRPLQSQRMGENDMRAPVKMSGNVRMQEVPFDPLAGPVAKTKGVKPVARTSIAKADVSKPIARMEAPKAEAKIQVAKAEPVKAEAPKVEAPKIQVATDAPIKLIAPKSEAPKIEAPKAQVATEAPVKLIAPRAETPKAQVAKKDVKPDAKTAVETKPAAKPETKPSTKPVKSQFAKSETKPAKDGIPRLRMAADTTD